MGPRLRTSRFAELLQYLRHHAGTDGASALADRETESLLERDRRDELADDIDIIAGHDHLGALGERHDAGDVGRAQVELRTIVAEERGMAPALLLGQDVDRTLEAGMRRNRGGFRED